MGDEQEVTSGWGQGGVPPLEAFHVERVVDPRSARVVIGMVRHTGHPWQVRLKEKIDPMSRDIGPLIGRRYLAELADRLELDAGRREWIHETLWKRLGLEAGTAVKGIAPGITFGWLPVTWYGPLDARDGPRRKLGSSWVAHGGAGSRRGTLVLLAGHVDTQLQLQFGADLGLRLVVHVDGDTARIHGVTLAGLCEPHALPLPLNRTQVKLGLRVLQDAARAALDAGQAWITNVEASPAGDGTYQGRLIVDGLAARWTGSAHGTKPSRSRLYDFRVEVSVDLKAAKAQVRHVHRCNYVGAEANHWRAVRSFSIDAASGPGSAAEVERRHSRPQALDHFRDDLLLNLDDVDGEKVLRFSNPTPWFETRTASEKDFRSGWLPTVQTRGGVVRAPRAAAQAAEPMSDAQGSVESHARASELFARLQAYHLDPETYFRFARLPLVQRVRPAMTWAPDGELPNAEVRPFFGDAEVDGVAGDLGDRPQLLVRYGSASAFHRAKLPCVDEAQDRLKAQYLSVASDPRWAWHEFGHVLTYAGTGELELPFAHGTGDALGAIVADPRSRLADGDPESPRRFVTFPWIEVPGRSHGRAAQLGWCWCGARNQVRLNFDAPQERYRHSYFGEQLMSSSLFRLYRSLGGDTRGGNEQADLLTRLEASDYCIYLVMQALALLGPDSVAPARTADQFVSALIDADRVRDVWDVSATWPFVTDPRPMRRRGGRVHKVIRWAFEAQGLYATDDPRAVAEAPGKAPRVDVFIADRRASCVAGAEEGGYAPVPLRATGRGALPWHAQAQALQRVGDQLRVQVRDRGLEAAAEVSVRAWWRTTADATWEEFSVAGERNAASAREFAFDWPSQAGDGPLWVLASAAAAADPSNLPLHAPELWIRSDDLLELVAHDNNLALAQLS